MSMGTIYLTDAPFWGLQKFIYQSDGTIIARKSVIQRGRKAPDIRR